MSLRDTLIRTREYLTDPAHWTQGEMFRDERRLSTRAHKATCACLVGAVSLATDGRGTEPRRAHYQDCVDFLDDLAGMPVIVWNDLAITTHSRVLALLDEAIAKCPTPTT